MDFNRILMTVLYFTLIQQTYQYGKTFYIDCYYIIPLELKKTKVSEIKHSKRYKIIKEDLFGL